MSAGVGVMLAAQVVRAQQQGGCTFTDESGKTVFWPNCQDPAEKKAVTPPANGQTQSRDRRRLRGVRIRRRVSRSLGIARRHLRMARRLRLGSGGAAGSSNTGGGAASKFPFPG